VQQRAYIWVERPSSAAIWWIISKLISIIDYIIDALKFNAVVAAIYENYVLIFLKIKGWKLALAQEGIPGCLIYICMQI
jgi:hypothetical protein